MNADGAEGIEDLLGLLGQVQKVLTEKLSEAESIFVTRDVLERMAIGQGDKLDAATQKLLQRITSVEEKLGLFEKLLDAKVENARLQLRQERNEHVEAELKMQLPTALNQLLTQRRRGFRDWMRANMKLIASTAMLLASLAALYFAYQGATDQASVTEGVAKNFGRFSN